MKHFIFDYSAAWLLIISLLDRLSVTAFGRLAVARAINEQYLIGSRNYGISLRKTTAALNDKNCRYRDAIALIEAVRPCAIAKTALGVSSRVKRSEVRELRRKPLRAKINAIYDRVSLRFGFNCGCAYRGGYGCAYRANSGGIVKGGIPFHVYIPL